MTQPPRRRSSATTIIVVIVAIAVACVPCTGIVAAIAIPSFIGYIRRSKTVEARANVRAIALGVASAYSIERVAPDGTMMPPGLPESLPRTPEGPPDMDRHFWPDDADPRWESDLGFAPTDSLYYVYEYERDPSGASFVVRAIGNLDGDAIESTFELGGRVVAGEVVLDGELAVTNELE